MLQTIELVDDDLVLSQVDLDNYLETKFIAYVQEIYEGTSAGHDNFNALISDITETAKKNTPSEVVRTSATKYNIYAQRRIAFFLLWKNWSGAGGMELLNSSYLAVELKIPNVNWK